MTIHYLQNDTWRSVQTQNQGREYHYAVEPKPRFLEAALACSYNSFLLPAEITGYRSVLSR